MPATIFSGQKIKTLKDTLTLNGKSDIISSMDDPTASAVDAPIGSLLINQTSGKLYRKLDAGSSVNWEEVGAGVGGINYILNPSAEVNTTGWATYADAAGTAPVDGTGGSPNVTWTRSTTSPLRGVADFNFAKDAANRQGQGVSYDFTIALADKAKVLSVTFDYEVLSGTYADGDLTVYLIADPAGTPVVIQPAGYTVLSATSGTTMRQRATFQTQATGTSYRLCFHVASTSASAYTLAIDNVVVGPQQTVQGAAISDWVSFTPTFNNISGFNISPNGVYRRVGDSIEVQVQFRKDASAGVSGSDVQLNLPFPMNTGKTAGGVKESTFGVWGGLHVPTFGQYNSGTIFRGDVSGTFVTFLKPAGASALLGTDFKAGAEFSLVFKYPAAGLSSNTVMSQDTDTRVVAFNVVSSAGTGTIAASFASSTAFIPSTVISTNDSHASWNASTGVYTVSVSGTYRISGGLKVEGTHGAGAQTYYYWLGLYKGASQVASQQMTSNQAIASNPFQKEIPFEFELPFVAGEQISLRVASSIPSPVYSNVSSGQVLSISRLSGPATIAASESVGFKATVTTTSIPSGTTQPMVFSNVVYSTHGAYNASTGVFKAPVSGKYQCNGAISVTYVANQDVGGGLSFFKNGVSQSWAGSVKHLVGGDTIIGNVISDIIHLNAGDELDLRCYQVNPSSAARSPFNGIVNYFSVMRVGN